MASLRPPYHPFDAWIGAQGKTREWAARHLQTTEASLSRIINGKRWPGREFFIRVESLTEGQVTAEHFINPKKQINPPHALSRTIVSAKNEPKAVRVRLDEDLLAEAAELGIDVNALADSALRERVKQERTKRWQAEHADVIAWYNDHVEREGIFGEEWRTF